MSSTNAESGSMSATHSVVPVSTEAVVSKDLPPPPPWEDTDIYVVSVDWHLRPNYGKGLAYRFSPEESAMLMLRLEEAVAVAFMDGRNTLGDIVDCLQGALSIDEADARAAIDGLLTKNRDDGDLLVTSLGHARRAHAHRGARGSGPLALGNLSNHPSCRARAA